MRSADVRSADVRSGEVREWRGAEWRGAETRSRDAATRSGAKKKMQKEAGWQCVAAWRRWLSSHETVHVAMDGLHDIECALLAARHRHAPPLARRSGAPELVQDGHLRRRGRLQRQRVGSKLAPRAARAALALSIASARASPPPSWCTRALPKVLASLATITVKHEPRNSSLSSSGSSPPRRPSARASDQSGPPSKMCRRRRRHRAVAGRSFAERSAPLFPMPLPKMERPSCAAVTTVSGRAWVVPISMSHGAICRESIELLEEHACTQAFAICQHITITNFQRPSKMGT